MMQKNGGIRILNLAWNGFADVGARILGDSLSTNTTLTDLDLSNNRISHRGLAALSAGLDKNSALTTLKVNITQTQQFVIVFDDISS